MKFRNFIPAFLFLLVAILMAVSNGLSEKPNFQHSMVGKQIPPFETKLLGSEEKFSDKDLTAKPSIVNFFASWCVACKAEHGILLGMKKDGYKIYGVDSGDATDKAQSYLKELGNPYTKVAVDGRRKLAVGFGTTGLPETFIVDTQGKITYHFRGGLRADNVAELKKAYAATK